MVRQQAPGVGKAMACLFAAAFRHAGGPTVTTSLLTRTAHGLAMPQYLSKAGVKPRALKLINLFATWANAH
jgi:hypothetical protein